MAELVGTVYINGEFLPAAEARLSVFDSGFIAGVNVFDTLACWQGRLFKPAAHLARFRRAAHAAAIPIVEEDTALEQIVVETVRRSGLRDAYVQCIATRGIRTLPYSWTDQPTLIVYAIPYVWIVPPDRIEQGISVIIPSTRNMHPQTLDPKIKTLNRLHSYFGKLEAARSGADEIVMLNHHGFLTESRGANVFLVRNGALFTPAEGILQGITRETVFEIAAAEQIPVAQGSFTAYDLYAADEAFLSSTAGGIIPVVLADGRTIGAGTPGPVTRLVTDRYWSRLRDGPDSTPVFDDVPGAAAVGEGR